MSNKELDGFVLTIGTDTTSGIHVTKMLVCSLVSLSLSSSVLSYKYCMKKRTGWLSVTDQPGKRTFGYLKVLLNCCNQIGNQIGVGERLSLKERKEQKWFCKSNFDQLRCWSDAAKMSEQFSSPFAKAFMNEQIRLTQGVSSSRVHVPRYKYV